DWWTVVPVRSVTSASFSSWPKKAGYQWLRKPSSASTYTCHGLRRCSSHASTVPFCQSAIGLLLIAPLLDGSPVDRIEQLGTGMAAPGLRAGDLGAAAQLDAGAPQAASPGR